MMTSANSIFEALQAKIIIDLSTDMDLPQLEVNASDEDYVRSDTLYRLARVFFAYSKCRDGKSDLLVLIRQTIRTFQPILLRTDIWANIKDDAVKFKLIGIEQEDKLVKIIAEAWRTTWLSGSEQIDVLKKRRKDESVPGDGLIKAMHPSWTTYRSEAQKAAVDAWVFASPGSTTLVTLPTGEGKSLCTILPAWYDAKGGTRSKGTTIVVVPTVALAHDQQKQAQRFFPDARDDFFEPWTRTGETSADLREEIERAIVDGSLPILYTSPESLIQSRLYYVCLQAARAGHLPRLVIDEAHLVETWGAGFRIEFQLLATYRRMLLEASKNQLKTLLLSATITRGGFDVLAHLFSENDNLVTVQANRLRTEIEYYFDYSYSRKEREQKILEALRILPRPLILYVTQPRQAEGWYKKLIQENYSRVEMFHGETPNSTRRKLIREWDENKIDIMVATSAFGLGVDKRHVRSVVHATAPENLDRLYQEVGRGGRDGFRSISLVSVIEKDKELASALLPKRLTVDLAYQRWRYMTETARTHLEKQDVILIDRDATRKDAPKMRVGDTNREWNFHMLLLMQRAGMIEITEIPPRNFEAGEVSWLPIRLIKPAIFTSEKMFRQTFNQVREKEQEDINRSRDHIFNLVKSYTLKPPNAFDDKVNCLAANIGKMYERAQLICSGCPVCRKSKQYLYPAEVTRFRLEYPEELAKQVNVEQTILDEDIRKEKMGGWHQFTLTWNGPHSFGGLQSQLENLASIFWKGFQQIIYPTEVLNDSSIRDNFIKHLSIPHDGQRDLYLHRLIPSHWLLEKNAPVFALNSIVIYPIDRIDARKLYQRMEETREDDIHIPYTLNIIHEDQRFDDGRRMLDVLDGINEPLDWYIQYESEKETDSDDTPLF